MQLSLYKYNQHTLLYTSTMGDRMSCVKEKNQSLQAGNRVHTGSQSVFASHTQPLPGKWVEQATQTLCFGGSFYFVAGTQTILWEEKWVR
jgi:hypothetical protein